MRLVHLTALGAAVAAEIFGVLSTLDTRFARETHNACKKPQVAVPLLHTRRSWIVLLGMSAVEPDVACVYQQQAVHETGLQVSLVVAVVLPLEAQATPPGLFLAL